MFSALPLVSSMRGVRKCNSVRPPSVWLWRTQVMSYCSGSIPAKASRSKSSITASCWSSSGASSMAKLMTPVV